LALVLIQLEPPARKHARVDPDVDVAVEAGDQVRILLNGGVGAVDASYHTCAVLQA
jgi:hypothetical protein